MKCTIIGSALARFFKQRTLDYKEGSDNIDLNMSCEGVKEEIKNLLDYNKYEDYVDSFICPTDLKFLKDIELSRLLLLIGYRPTVGMVTREAFHQQLMRFQAGRIQSVVEKWKSEIGKEEPRQAHREMTVESSKLRNFECGNLTLAFVEAVNKKGQTVMGYLDLKTRMRASDIATSFDLVSRWLVPCKDDLTYYNFTSNTARNNPTKDFQVSEEQHGSSCSATLVFHLSKLGTFLHVSPRVATLSGPGASSLTVQTEKVPSRKYKRIIFYNIALLEY